MPKLFIAGDSTAAIKLEEKRPESGWGEFLADFISPNLEVRNFAQNGRSTKSFVEEGILDQIDKEIMKDDYLIIQFGHNDEKKEDPKRYTTAYGTYQENLLKFVLTARRHEAIPILITSITRRRFIDKEYMDPNALGEYPLAMLEVAKKYDVKVIDMFKISQKLLQDLGDAGSRKLFMHFKPNESKNYPNGLEDNTHFNPYGAQMMASIIANELKKII
jgi:lysophospholipase L1-like esterase